MNAMLDDLTTTLSGMVKTSEDKEWVATTLNRLEIRYELAKKISREPGVKDIVQQLMGRIYQAYGDLTAVQGQRILDIACGSNTSKAPAFIFVDTPFGERKIPIPHLEGYSAQFEPWFCRILLELGADPVGVDFGNLDAEAFEHYFIDLGQPGALNLLPDQSFDAVQDSRLFGSPEFTAQFPDLADRLRIAEEIWRQEQRLLKPQGFMIHSDASNLVQQNRLGNE